MFSQEEGTVKMDIITLKMTPELSALFQKRVEEGGQTAATAIERLPDLAKSQKIELLDHWQTETKNSEMTKRSISIGKDISLEDGEKLASGIKIRIEPTLVSGSEFIRARWDVRSELPISGDRDNYSLHQKITGLSVKQNEWVTMGSWQRDQQVVMFLGKFNSTDAPNRASAPQERLLQNSLEYGLYLLPENSSAHLSSTQVSGAAARELVNKGSLLEAGSATCNSVGKFIVAFDKTLSLKDPGAENAPGFTLEACVDISGDLKTAEMGFSATYTPKRGGARLSTVSYNDRLELTVGELSLVSLKAENHSRKETFFLAIELKSKVLQSNTR